MPPSLRRGPEPGRRVLRGFGLPQIARADLHMWEEPCLSGSRGAGAIFFCGCNLTCLFCQNYTISHGAVGPSMDAAALAGLMLRLQDKAPTTSTW